MTLVFSEEILTKADESHFTVTDESNATVGTGELARWA